MKKIISTLLLLALVGCEIYATPHNGKVFYPEATVMWEPINSCGYDPYPYPVTWADYCVDDCCMWEVYDGIWMCQELWCYDEILCEWNVTEVCYQKTRERGAYTAKLRQFKG